MSTAPFMQLYVADYLADTLDLSTVEHGAYLLLLMTMWRHDARLPNDPAKLARIARLSTTKFKQVWAEISRFFEVDGETITNRRLLKEHQKASKKSEIRATAGSAGGKAKALKSNDTALANASDLTQHSSDIRYQIEEERAKALLSSGDDETPEGDPPAEDEAAAKARMQAEAEAAEIEAAVTAYNAAAAASGWPSVQKLTTARKAALRARLKDAGGIEGWRFALSKARASPHCNGQNDRGWTANFDFLTQQSSFAKLMEGNYDPRPANPGSRSPGSAYPVRNGQPGGLVGAAMRGIAGREN